MKRISTSTAVDGRFVDGNKSIGRRATQFCAEWCNQIQEELANLLELNGVSLDGSERQLYDLVSDMFGRAKEIEYLTDSGSLTSQQIVNVYKSGRLPVVKMGGGGSGTQTTLYFYPKSIYYKDEGYGSNINRDCLFFAVNYVKESGEDFYRMKVQIRRYYNIPAPDQGEKYSETVVDLTYPESMHSDTVFLGSTWKIEKAVYSTDEYLVVRRLNGSTWEDVAVFRSDGSRLKISGGCLDLVNWAFSNPTNTTLQLATTDNDAIVAMSFDKTTGNTTVHRDLKVNKVFTLGDNVHGADATFSLLSSDMRDYPNKTIVTVCNTHATNQINVTYKDQKSENIRAGAAKQFVKYSGTWYPINAYDPQAHD